MYAHRTNKVCSKPLVPTLAMLLQFIHAILMCFAVQKECSMCRKAAEEGEKQKDGPFFLFIYVDDKICVARGRGGGLAMW